MDIFDVLTLVGGLCLFLFGMSLMGDALERSAGSKLETMIGKLTTGKFAGLLTGLGVTAVIQSSSATTVMVVGFVNSKLMTLKQAIHVIMGANIGTTVTAWIFSVGTTKNARRAALVHLSFNVIGTIVCLTAFTAIKALVTPAILGESATYAGIATAHSVFNIVCTLLLLPMSGLLATPAIALECAHHLTFDMAKVATDALKDSIVCLTAYDKAKAAAIRQAEDRTDHLEDIIGSYLAKLSTKQLNEDEGATASMLLKAIGDFERVSDHAVNILESIEEMQEKGIAFSEDAQAEIWMLISSPLLLTNRSLYKKQTPILPFSQKQSLGRKTCRGFYYGFKKMP